MPPNIFRQTAAEMFLNATDVLVDFTGPIRRARSRMRYSNLETTLSPKSALNRPLKPRKRCERGSQRQPQTQQKKSALQEGLALQHEFEQFLDDPTYFSFSDNESNDTLTKITNEPAKATNEPPKANVDPTGTTKETCLECSRRTAIDHPSITRVPHFLYALTSPSRKARLRSFEDPPADGGLIFKSKGPKPNIPGLLDTKGPRTPFRVLITCSNFPKIRRLNLVPYPFMRMIGTWLFPGANENQLSKNQQLRQHDDEEIIFDYCVPEGELNPKVVIAAAKFHGHEVSVRVFRDRGFEKRVNRKMEARDRSFRERLRRGIEAQKKEMKQTCSKKREWANDEDEMEENEMRRKRQRRSNGGEIKEEAMMELTPLADGLRSLSDEKAWDQWLNQPRVTIEGMDDFNFDD